MLESVGLLATSRAPVAPSNPRPQEFEDITRSFVVNVVLPVWLGAGIADWVCHRRTRIEDTTGPKESLVHLAMLTEAAIPVLCGMFLEITSPVLALAITAAQLHDATALWDVSYAVTRSDAHRAARTLFPGNGADDNNRLDQHAPLAAIAGTARIVGQASRLAVALEAASASFGLRSRHVGRAGRAGVATVLGGVDSHSQSRVKSIVVAELLCRSPGLTDRQVCNR
ncbi:MAG: hypothetical protein JO122_00855 [Acetobacteraceae bacterium]|nr:hypothetical protein [Acetobacteraceae bacterium]